MPDQEKPEDSLETLRQENERLRKEHEKLVKELEERFPEKKLARTAITSLTEELGQLSAITFLGEGVETENQGFINAGLSQMPDVGRRFKEIIDRYNSAASTYNLEPSINRLDGSEVLSIHPKSEAAQQKLQNPEPPQP